VDIGRLLAELRLELEQLDEVIECFERVALLGAKRQGRPPKWLLQIKAKNTRLREAAAAHDAGRTGTAHTPEH
jgi:hypothetical protein